MITRFIKMCLLVGAETQGALVQLLQSNWVDLTNAQRDAIDNWGWTYYRMPHWSEEAQHWKYPVHLREQIVALVVVQQLPPELLAMFTFFLDGHKRGRSMLWDRDTTLNITNKKL